MESPTGQLITNESNLDIKDWMIDLVDRRLDKFDEGINARIDDGKKVV